MPPFKIPTTILQTANGAWCPGMVGSCMTTPKTISLMRTTGGFLLLMSRRRRVRAPRGLQILEPNLQFASHGGRMASLLYQQLIVV